MPIICLMVRENHKMVREMSGKSQGILWGLMAGHPELIFLFENCYSSLWVLLKFVPNNSIDNKYAFVQVTARHKTNEKPLAEPDLTKMHDVIWHHQGPLLLTWFNFNPSMDK